MARMHSPRTQCCCCAGNIFFMLFGILMLSTGTCLVLNYGQLDVDTGGLPPEWQNEEGKKIVGIILICCGFVSMGISALMGALYFTVCSRPKPPTNAITPRLLNGVKTPRDGKPLPKSRDRSHGGSVLESNVNTTASNYSVPANQPRHGKHQKRARKKRNLHNLKQGMYASRLATHSEYDEVHNVMKEDLEMTDSIRSVDSTPSVSSEPRKTSVDAEVKPSVIMSVSSLHPTFRSEPGVPNTQPGHAGRLVTQPIRSYTELTRHTPMTHSPNNFLSTSDNVPGTSEHLPGTSVNPKPSASSPGMSASTPGMSASSPGMSASTPGMSASSPGMSETSDA